MKQSDGTHGCRSIRRARSPRTALCLAYLSAACAAGRVPKAAVLQINLHGVQQVDQRELVDGLAHHPPAGWPERTYASFDPLQLTIDRQRIIAFYQARGFYDARLEDVEVTARPDGYEVAFSVHEGRPFTIRSIEVDGLPEGAHRKAAALVPFAEGDVFQYPRYETAKQDIVRVLTQAGYAHAQVDGQVEVFRQDGEVAVHLTVDPGPLVRFGAVRIDAGPLPASAIRARLAFRPGDVYHPSLLSLTEARIYELGLAGVVMFYLPTDRDAPVMDVGIRVKAGPNNELRLGAGIARQSPNYQIRFRAGYVRRDFFHPLVRVSSEVRPALLYRRSAGRFAFGIEWALDVTREDLFVSRLIGQAQVQYNLLQYEAYATLGPAVRLVARRPWLDDRLQFSVGVAVKFNGFPRVDSAIPRSLFEQVGLPPCDERCQRSGTPAGQTLAYVEPAITYDGRDDPVDPRRGLYARAHLEVGNALNDANGAWMRFTPELRGYLCLGSPRVVVAGRARTGVKLLGNAPLPSTQRYFGGGSESQRGFTIRQLSPFFGDGDDSVPVGGEALFELSTEIRLHIARVFGMWLGVVGFVDAADVGRKVSDIDWLAPHVAAGGGLRLFTPIGPLRADIGYRLNRVQPGVEPGGADRLAFHLSLGEAF